MTTPGPETTDEDAGRASLELADWRRRIATLYTEVRELAMLNPRTAWEHWRVVRQDLYRDHPQSPIPTGQRSAFRARHWPYDPSLRFEIDVNLTDPSVRDNPAPVIPMSTGARLDFSRIGHLAIPFRAGMRTLDLYWMAGYAGGLFLPFRDTTNGSATYGAGRYVLDTAKGVDLGAGPAGGLILDFNFAFQPSCAFDPRWACPLAPPENRLDVAVEAGERIA